MATILVPTDFSENAANAVQYAASLAVQTSSRLLLVHTVSVPVSVMPEGIPLLSVNTQLMKASEEALGTLAHQLNQSFSLEVETLCLSGPLIPLLNEVIKTQTVDLVVMGTQGAGDLLTRLIGTNSTVFIKEASCPVLVVPAHAKFSPIRHIAYASDFETEETVYLKQLFQLASTLNSEVHIINITSEHELNIVSDRQVLKSIKKHFPHHQYSVAQMRYNDVVAGLKKFVQENQMDLLAVSIQDRDLLEYLFHHSITIELAIQAFVPLLTLPANPYYLQAQRSVSNKTVSAGADK
ncbi:universal stress protein [Rufibacter tibetensis]|uniref:UspA domain-containing protein n=1 Tax=Rufibacter tibetensis TaxID=512763 RepID=A0A0P0CRQ3_9BACT|nr:universal stress protein [Rufibacter tibetensis]ALJ00108.1 hypothetical protein DC20_15405 [Rufibacter tibetensis]